jgi:intracellular multiplication protein IcmV
MKNKSSSRIGRFLKTIINIRAWFDWDRMRSFTYYLIDGIKKFFTPQEAEKKESFEEAKKRLRLSDKALLAKEKGLLRVSILMVCFGIGFFIYSMYHFYYFQILGGILSLVVMSIALTLAFRYHFWYFQIKERKLGCSVDEWFRQTFRSGKR